MEGKNEDDMIGITFLLASLSPVASPYDLLSAYHPA
jgi:hypothetical protein